MSKGINPISRNYVQVAPLGLNKSTPVMTTDPASFPSMAKLLSGALAAGTWKPVLNLTGPGVLQFTGLGSIDYLSRTLSLQIVLDGVTCFSGGVAVTDPSQGFIAVGTYQYGPLTTKQKLCFAKSCVVSVQSTVAETDKAQLLYAYRLC